MGKRLICLPGDHLGSTSLTTDAVGNVVARRRYAPYGKERWAAGTLPTDFGFTGQRDVHGTGLMYYRARYYHPALGRFVSADTVVHNPGDPQSLNRYAYVQNNPLKYTDPTGHALWAGDGWDTGDPVPEWAQAVLAGILTDDEWVYRGLMSTSDHSTNNCYWTAYSIPEDAGLILRYSTNFEATPKIVTVYSPASQGLEMQNVWRYKSGYWGHSREDHFAVGGGIPGIPISLGFDHQLGGGTNPEVNVGPVKWGGNELMVEAKVLGSGVEAGAEYGAAGDFYIITTGDVFNKMGVEGIQNRYISQKAMIVNVVEFPSYAEAFDAFSYLNRAQQAYSGFPYRWKTTE